MMMHFAYFTLYHLAHCFDRESERDEGFTHAHADAGIIMCKSVFGTFILYDNTRCKIRLG